MTHPLTAAEHNALARLEAERRYDLVLEGGGVRGIALAGALSELQARGYVAQRIAGTSAGAVVAALFAAGYSGAELEGLILSPEFRRLADFTPLARVPLVGGLLSILFLLGQCEGAELEDWLRARLLERGVRTFADLRRVHGHSVQVIVTDLTARSLLVLPDDAGQIGLDPDGLEVALAVHMSAAIPLYYRPVVRLVGGTRRWLVDGGVLSNFPVWLFDAPPGDLPRWPTFGLRLTDTGPTPDDPVQDPVLAGRAPVGLVRYLTSIVYTMLAGRDRYALSKADFARTILLPTLGVGLTEFDLSPERAAQLFEAGRQAAADFLDRWDFPAYLAAYRMVGGPGQVAQAYAE